MNYRKFHTFPILELTLKLLFLFLTGEHAGHLPITPPPAPPAPPVPPVPFPFFFFLAFSISCGGENLSALITWTLEYVYPIWGSSALLLGILADLIFSVSCKGRDLPWRRFRIWFYGYVTRLNLRVLVLCQPNPSGLQYLMRERAFTHQDLQIWLFYFYG